jgi:hypothetical protein
MDPKHKKYILDNACKKTPKEIAAALGLKEKKVKKFIESKNIPSYNYTKGKIFYPIVSIAGLIIIVIIALFIRISPVIRTPETERFGMGIFGDTASYHNIAYNMARGMGFSRTPGEDISSQKFQTGEATKCLPAFHRAPAYPFFISLVYRFFGIPEESLSARTWHINWDRVRLAQCILDAICCVFIFFIVRMLYTKSPWPSLISSALYAFSFYNIFYTRELLSETLTTFLVTLFVLMSISAMKRGTTRMWLITGAIFGLIPLSRPEYLPFAGFFAVFMWFIYKLDVRAAIKNISVFLIGAVLVIAPWSVRNYMVFKKPIVISQGGLGEGLYLGAFEIDKEAFDWNWLPEDKTLTDEEKKAVKLAHDFYAFKLYSGTIDEVKELDRFYLSLTLKRIRSYPVEVFKNWILKIPRLWYQDYVPKYDKKEANGWFFIFYFCFAVYGFFTVRGFARSGMMLVMLLFLYLTVMFMPFEIEPRYGVPLMPAIICLTGIGIWNLGKRLLQ